MVLIRAAACVVLAILTTGLCRAQGFFVGDAASSSVAMGATGVAFPQDAAAAVVNPAGLCRVHDGLIVNAGLVYFTHAQYHRAPDIHSDYQSYPTVAPEPSTLIGAPLLAVAEDFGVPRWRFAFSSNVNFGSKLLLDPDGPQRYMMKRADFHVWNEALAASYAIDDRWSVGGSVIYAVGSVHEEIDLDLLTVLDPTAQPSGKRPACPW